MHNIKQKCDHLSTTFITCYYLVIFELNWMNSCKNPLLDVGVANKWNSSRVHTIEGTAVVNAELALGGVAAAMVGAAPGAVDIAGPAATAPPGLPAIGATV